MARGWESKAVESQQEEAMAKSSGPRVQTSVAEAARRREEQGLRLARARIVQQLKDSKDPRHRKMLESALADLDNKLRQNAKG